MLVLTTSFGTVDAFFGSHVPDGGEEPVFAHLVADEVVDAVLELVDLGDTGDFGFGEGVLVDMAMLARTLSLKQRRNQLLRCRATL